MGMGMIVKVAVIEVNTMGKNCKSRCCTRGVNNTIVENTRVKDDFTNGVVNNASIGGVAAHSRIPSHVVELVHI